MYFELLHTRLVDHLRERVRSGALTERGLARLTGVSQPHLHNVLKGIRVLSAEMADQVVTQLQLSPLDLLAESELGRPPSAVFAGRYMEVPVLEQKLGPGRSFPDMDRRSGALPFVRAELTGVVRPFAVRLAQDPQQGCLFHGGDVALLAPLPANGSPDRDGGGNRYYAIETGGSSLIRRLQRRGDTLLLVADDDAEGTACIHLTDRNILEVVRARVIWIGRYLENSPLADRPIEEAGRAHRPPGAEG
jgi:hypothetical protein